MGWPQIIVIGLLFLQLLVATVVHGKPQTPHDATVVLFRVCLWSGLLYWGGFFKVVA
jgi:hypothetical protein